MNKEQTMTKLEQLREQAKAKTMEAINLAREKAETNRLQAIINGNLASIIAKQEVAADTSNKLKSLEEQCVQLVQTLPVYSKATRELRKFNPSRVYGFGNQIASLVGILSGIQYSATEHRMQLLELTNLNEQIIEDTLDAFGSPAYFSTNYNTIVPERPYDHAKALECIKTLEYLLDISVDTSKVTEATMKANFELARLKAETARDNYSVAVATKTIKVED